MNRDRARLLHIRDAIARIRQYAPTREEFYRDSKTQDAVIRNLETLEESSRGWHEGTNDPWPYVNYLLYVLKEAYREFEARVGQVGGRRGEKREVVLAAVGRTTGAFRLSDLQRECPGVSVDMIRHVLKELRDQGTIECSGRGRGARWHRIWK